ncbi:MAG: hypothetical protein C0487_00880 [Leptothrix sp. (in: Bacteria)]|nr:hypothetical protein [Leptothrix sp. (in: b-proteobacteria)]
MSSDRMEALALKKHILQQESAALRRGLALEAAVTLAPVFRTADRVHQGGRWLLTHPALVTAVVGLLFRRRPKGLLSWAGRAWWIWRTWRRLQPLLAGKANT